MSTPCYYCELPRPQSCSVCIHGEEDVGDLMESIKDRTRLDWMAKKLTGASDSERYLPLRVYWGDHRDIRKAIDKVMDKERK